MLFNSFEFLVFFPIVCGIYFLLKRQRPRLWLLFLSSCFFYAFFIPSYLLILFLVIGIDFFAAKMISSAESHHRKKLFLGLSLAANLAILAFFKYANFTIDNFNHLAQFFRWNYSVRLIEIILPIGLSFHTFQSMAYVFEVYYGRYRAEKDLLAYSVYVLYFPQLVAGPIERPQNILPQLHQHHSYDATRVVTGLYLVAQGLFKKSVVADGLAPLANQVFAQPSSFGLFATALGVIAFSFQIYCDFSGYSDIARGTSRVFGIELMRNFNKPYFAMSIGEFWRRWHISLSTWFRDYLFIPLGGSHGPKAKTCFNLLLVFAVSGLWHGASWTFVIWGALHGSYLVIENLFLKPAGQASWPKWFARTYVFLLVAITWIFFRASSLAEAIEVLGGLYRPMSLGWVELPLFRVQETIFLIFALIAFEWLDEREHFWNRVAHFSGPVRWAFYWVIVLTFLFMAQFSGTQFIYFQF